MPTHTLSWMDAELAALNRCDGTRIPDSQYILDAQSDEPLICPVCGKSLRLVWDVHVEEVE